MTFFKPAIATLAAATLAACANAPALTPENAAFNRAQDEFPDLDAVEFAALDENSDGILDASERANIDSDEVGGIDIDD